MPHNIDIAATADGLNQFVNQFSSKIHQELKQGLEFDVDLPSVTCEESYTGQDITVNSLLQPYQPAFTPNNTESLDGITSTLQVIKSDLLFTAEQLEKFKNKWKPQWFDADPENIRSKYGGYVIGQHILPQLAEELNLASWAGDYVAPAVPGTPGAVLESVDGYAKAITGHINDGRLTPITTGALVDGTIVDQVRAFCKAVPEPYRYKQGRLIMSKTNAQRYADRYAEQFPRREVITKTPDKMVLSVDHYNKDIHGYTCMEGSDRIILVFDNLESMIVGKRTGYPEFFNFRFQAFDRTLKCFAEIYRFYNMETCLHMFVNEQV